MLPFEAFFAMSYELCVVFFFCRECQNPAANRASHSTTTGNNVRLAKNLRRQSQSVTGDKTRATSPGPGPVVRWPMSGAPLGSQSLSVVAALLGSAGWSPE